VHTDDVLRESTTEITAGNSCYMFEPHGLLDNFCVVSNGERRGSSLPTVDGYCRQH